MYQTVQNSTYLHQKVPFYTHKYQPYEKMLRLLFKSVSVANDTIFSRDAIKRLKLQKMSLSKENIEVVDYGETAL